MQAVVAQTTYVAVVMGDINSITTWSSTNSVQLPLFWDSNIWSSGVNTLKVGATGNTSITFNGGTLDIASGGTLVTNVAGAALTLNNVTLNGGRILAGNNNGFNLYLQNKTFELNSGALVTNTSLNSTACLQVKNCSLAGNGNITIASSSAAITNENNVEFTSTGVTTNGFTGKFTVSPGVYSATTGINGYGGTLKISAPTSGTFGISIPSPSSGGVLLPNGTIYSSTLNGKLFFNPGSGNSLTLVSLNLGGTDIAPGTYTYSDFTPTQQAFLNPASTGTIIITGAVNPPINVTGGTSVSFDDTFNSGGYAISIYTVTPYDQTTLTPVTPVTGTSSPIKIPGLILNHSYTFTVTATNTVGVTSAASTPSAPVLITLPGVPVIGKAYVSGLSAKASVCFTAPQNDGNSPITNYIAISNPTGGTGTLNQSGSGIITVSGLTSNKAYTFSVKALTEMGTSAASAASNSVILPVSIEFGLNNGIVHLKQDLTNGGAISYISKATDTRNIVNIHDDGRYIQQSYYAGNSLNRQSEGQSPSWSPWVWNPIQVGDYKGNSSQILASYVTADTLYVKCIPMLWDMNNKPAEAFIEQWTSAKNNVIHVKNKLTNFRTDVLYGENIVKNQELPAMYPISALNNLYSYFGNTPFTNDVFDYPPVVNLSSGFWGRYNSVTENWMAFVDNTLWGVGVYNPLATSFLAGLSGSSGSEATSASTNYIAPIRNEAFMKNTVYQYEYYLIIGSLIDIRSNVYSLHSKLTTKEFSPIDNVTMNIYPTPATNIIYVEIPQHTNLEIINQQGQVLKRLSITESITQVDISMLQTGLNFIKANLDNKTIVKRFIKL